MAENGLALYILQKKNRRGRTLILERNIKGPFAPRGKVSLGFYKGRAQPGLIGRAPCFGLATPSAQAPRPAQLVGREAQRASARKGSS